MTLRFLLFNAELLLKQLDLNFVLLNLFMEGTLSEINPLNFALLVNSFLLLLLLLHHFHLFDCCLELTVKFLLEI